MIKENINSKLCNSIISYQNGHLENNIVEFFIENAWCKIFNLFNSHNNISENEFSFYFDSLYRYSIITGNFNSHHSHWSERNSYSNFSDRSLDEAINSNFLFNLLTPPGTSAYFNSLKLNYTSTVDFVFGSGKFSTLYFMKLENPLGSSNHYPIFYCFNKLSNSLSSSWNFHNFHWKK